MGELYKKKSRGKPNSSWPVHDESVINIYINGYNTKAKNILYIAIAKEYGVSIQANAQRALNI